MVVVPQKGKYFINGSDRIRLLISYFNSSEEKVSEAQADVEPMDYIDFYAISSYYGGAFSLAQNTKMVFNNEKYAIAVGDKYIDLPVEINNIMTNGLTQMDDSVFYEESEVG